MFIFTENKLENTQTVYFQPVKIHLNKVLSQAIILDSVDWNYQETVQAPNKLR